MKAFAQLYQAIDETNKTNEKVAAMVQYFRDAPPDDAAWTVHFLIGRRPKRAANSTRMAELAVHLAGIPGWLFGESYEAVGDLAETISLILPDFEGEHEDRPLSYWVEERLLRLPGLSEEEQVQALAGDWMELDRQERFAYTKLITGAFRVGVSQELVVRAISQVSGIPAPVIAHRLMGDWTPSAAFYEALLAEESGDTDVSRPYPFCLAHPLEQELASLGPIQEWHAEWKWDGIRAQLIRREGQSFVWSRGEELITERFPEMVDVCEALPNGTVLDGEILAWAEGKPQKFMALQRRIGRKLLSKKILQEVPAVLVAFDILEYQGEDLRERPYSERRARLEELVETVNTAPPEQLVLGQAVDPILATDDPDEPTEPGLPSTSRLLISSRVEAASWEELAERRQESRNLNVEGLMLKRLDSPYLVGRKKGNWWKWKIEPLTVDAVLIYAQRGSGKRASLYTDYTFGVWDDEGKLVPFAKAYSGLTDEEIRKVDSWVRRNTREKFGPVRTVEPELVMELAFEGIQLSNRHKSGLAVRFPRILRWRHDKKPTDADSLESVREMLKAI
jgi:DNA ligase-1